MNKRLRAGRPALGLVRVALFAILLNAGLSPIPSPVDAVAACTTSGPPSAAYTVTVCLATPADGAVLSGSAAVSGTFSVSGTNPGIQRIVFFLRGAYLLTDYASPYTFTLATSDFVDGAAALEVEANMKDGFVSSRATNNVTLANGVTSPPVNTNTFTPTVGNWSGSGPITVAAAGDGASGEPNAQAATDLIASWNPNLLLYLGDVYEKGTSTEFDNWYGNATSFYGRFRAITDPTIGNHEYEGALAPGYFDYWDNIPHYYSYTIGPWHFVSLDSTSQFNQANPGSPQYTWLANDLTLNNAPCTLVYFHHPVYSVGPNGDTTRMNSMWSLMASHGVDVVLAGHDHDYQRWLALDGAGNPSPGGITQLIVGTGGHGIQGFSRTDSRLAVGFDTSPSAIGALRLSLSDGFAGFQFVNSAGLVRDQGTVSCQAGAADTSPPTAPGALTATAIAANRVDLTWTAATDNVGVAAYDIYRDGAFRSSVGATSTSWSDTSVTGQQTYTYTVKARDLSNNASEASNGATVTTPSGGGALLFSDGFESGALIPAWSDQGGMSVQSAEVYAGTKAARALSNNAAAWAYHQLTSTMGELYYRVRFKIVSVGANNLYIQKVRTSTGTSIGGFYRSSSSGTLAYRNDAGAVTVSSTTPVSLGTWHELQVHLRINGTNGVVETWLDGTRVAALSRTDNFGTAPVGRVQIGDNSGLRTFDLAIDDVAVNQSFISDSVLGDTTPPTAPGGLTAQAASSTRVDLSWLPSTDDVGVVAYDVYRNGETWDSVLGNAASYADTTVDPGTTYTYVVRARDQAGNTSAPSASAVVTTPGSSDTTPPSVPGSVTATGISISRIDLDWADSTDDTAVTGYTVYRNGVFLATTGPTSAYSDTTGLSPNTTYSYEIDAFDAAGHHSARSAPPVTGTTLADTTPPTAPTNLNAQTVAFDHVTLTWSAASDNVGVVAYDVYRNGGPTAVGSVNGSTLTWTDSSVATSTQYSYVVKARDAVGLSSGASNQVTVTTPATAPPLFICDFESGNLTQWNPSGAFAITQTNVHAGTFAARALSTNTPAWAWASLSSSSNEVYARTWLRIAGQPSKTTTLLKLRTSSGTSILDLMVTNKGKLSYRNDASGKTVNGATTISMAVYHEVVVRLKINGTAGLVQVWVDGVLRSDISRTDNFGTAAIGRIQLGEDQSGRPSDVTFDDVEVRQQPFGPAPP